MKNTEIRNFNLDIDQRFAKAFLDTGLYPSNLSPEELVKRVRTLINQNIMGHLMIILGCGVFVLLGLLCIGTWWSRGWNLEAFSTREILLWFWVLAGSGFIAIGGTLYQGQHLGETTEHYFLCRLWELQRVYGAPLDFSNWENTKYIINWELTMKASNILAAEDSKMEGWQEFKKTAQSKHKALLGVCANFKHLTINGQDEEPYYKKARAMFKE